MSQVDFASLTIGTKLADQFGGVTFLRYRGIVGGVVIDSPTGHVASFNDAPGIEFFSSGANIAFSTLQRTVSLHVGLLPITGLTVQLDLRLTAYDAAGTPRAMAVGNVTAGAGFSTVLTVATAAPTIVTVVLEAASDPFSRALIAVRDITYEDVVSGASPDFGLDGPPGANLVQGGRPVDIPLSIRRIGGSLGAISFSWGGLPAGVTGAIFPNPADWVFSNVVFRLQAAVGPAPEAKTVVITGTPLVPSAGPGPRTLDLSIATTPMLRVVGSAEVDFATCNPSGSRGTVVRDYLILRDPTVSGPIRVSLEGLPADVMADLDPPVLNFPGAATGQYIRIRFSTIAGPVVPDTIIVLHLQGEGLDLSFSIFLHGTCPQNNRNFVIRGQFGYINQGDSRWLNGAQVEIFRYRPVLPDDYVGGMQTDANGRFSLDLFASRDGDYYARLRLHSAELQLEDADNSSVWSWDTPHYTNRGGLIDVGSIRFQRDDGRGTPRAAVWQGFRDAAVEFQQVAGDKGFAGGFFLVKIYRGHVTPLTWYDEVHWAHAYPTGESANRYRVTRHEFAHIFRDRLDGDRWHWMADNFLYVYGRSHDHCHGTILFGFSSRESGFAFHEGWAEYWSDDAGCCGNAIDNQDIEGTVAHDLARLDQGVWVGADGVVHTVGRQGMVQVLGRGPNLIHSDSEFRREFHKQFPSVPLGTISDGCVEATSAALTADQTRYLILDTTEQRKGLIAAIRARKNALTSLRKKQAQSDGLQEMMFGAAADEMALILQRMETQLAEFDQCGSQQPSLGGALLEQRRDADFAAKRREIQVRALHDALSLAPSELHRDIRRKLWVLGESRIEDPSLESMLSAPRLVGDDTVVRQRSRVQRVHSASEKVRRRSRGSRARSSTRG